MKYSGGTFSGYKSMLCAPEITVLGHRCTAQGCLPDQSRVVKIVNWGPCKDLTDVRAFLGTIGVCRLFIENFAHHAPSRQAYQKRSRMGIWIRTAHSHGGPQESTPYLT